MKQGEVVTRRRSQRHATGVIDTRALQQHEQRRPPPQQQQQQQQSVSQEPVTVSVLTRQRKRKCAEINDKDHLTQSRIQTSRRPKEPRNSSLHIGSTPAIQTACASELPEEKLLETGAGTWKPKMQTQTGLHVANNRQQKSEEPEEQLVEVKAGTLSTTASKESIQQTGKTAVESQDKCEREETMERTAMKHRTKRTNKVKSSKNKPSNIERRSEIHASSTSEESQLVDTTRRRQTTKERRKKCHQIENTAACLSGTDKEVEHQDRTRTRKFKEPQQTGSDAKSVVDCKNRTATQITSESEAAEKHPVETITRRRREKKPKQTNFSTAAAATTTTTVCGSSDAEDQKPSGTAAVRTYRRVRRTKTAIDADEKSTNSSENSRESDALQQTSKTGTTAVAATTSFKVSKQIRRSGKSGKSPTSRKPESKSGPSPECCPSAVDSEDKEQADFGELAASSKDVEDDEETQWHMERRANLSRSLDDAIILPVTCGPRHAELVLNRLESGSRGACVRQSNGLWLTPNEFQLISGRGNAKDWKRSIRHHGHSLKSLTEQGLLSLASPPLCICQYCDVQVG